MNAEVFGVSPDSAKSHQKFRAKYALPYRLLVDEEHRLADSYGIWKEKKLYGMKYMGRSSSRRLRLRNPDTTPTMTISGLSLPRPMRRPIGLSFA